MPEKSEEALFYDASDITSRPIPAKDAELLQQMTMHPGWRSYVRLKAEDAEDMLELGMNHKAKKSERDVAVGAFRVLQGIITLENSLEVALEEAPHAKEDLNLDVSPSPCDNLGSSMIRFVPRIVKKLFKK